MLSSSNPSTGLCSKDQGPCNTLDQPLEPHPWRRRPSSDAVAAGHCPGTGPRRHHACQQDLRLSPAAILRLHQVLVRTIMDPQSERRHRMRFESPKPHKGRRQDSADDGHTGGKPGSLSKSPLTRERPMAFDRSVRWICITTIHQGPMLCVQKSFSIGRDYRSGSPANLSMADRIQSLRQRRRQTP